MKIVVYTAIFGPYDKLIEEQVVPPGVDFICFTDQDFESKTWQIRKALPLYEDNTRTARKYKVLPHRFLPEYDVSIWIDGNKQVVGNIMQYIEKIKDVPFATFDHTKCYDKRDCIYDEYAAIMHLGAANGNFKDYPQVMYDQIERYQLENYPKHNGLVFTCVVVRKHNGDMVKKIGEDWWIEIKHGSKRDQLSFNYVAWKRNFLYNFLDGDGRNDGIVKHYSHSK